MLYTVEGLGYRVHINYACQLAIILRCANIARVIKAMEGLLDKNSTFDLQVSHSTGITNIHYGNKIDTPDHIDEFSICNYKRASITLQH